MQHSSSTDHRLAARAAFNSGIEWREREGQFLGGLSYRSDPITEKQARWLNICLGKAGLPSIDGEAR